MATQTYFFTENETKEEIYKTIQVDRKSIHTYIDVITKKASNNRMGYFQFLDPNSGDYYQIYIIPKIYTISNNRDCNECKTKFINLLKTYYHLIAKYEITDHMEKLESNISDFAHISQERVEAQLSDTMQMDDFLVFNYESYLKNIEYFFNKHKSFRSVAKHFTSQSIKNRLNTRQNILEPNKSTIHQIKDVAVLNSILATITLSTLKQFKKQKLQHFTKNQHTQQLTKQLNKLEIKLKQKFKEQPMEFNLRELTSAKIQKLFNRNNEYKTLYQTLLILTGKEHYYSDNAYRTISKIEQEITSIFFRPEKLYEWIIYDKLIQSKEFEKVLKDDKDIVVEKYYVESLSKSYDSKPDVVVYLGNKGYPIDAKWKILEKHDPDLESDIAKLRRDAMIRGANKGYLIYPKIDEKSEFKPNKEYSYSFDNDFSFEFRVIGV